MSNGLSQAEIDALLRGDSVPGVEPSPPEEEGVPVLSPQDIDRAIAQEESPEELLAPLSDEEARAAMEAAGLTPGAPAQDALTPMEIDAVGEIGNISMGTSATTLFALLNRRVDITTPRVKVSTIAATAREYPLPFIAVEVKYTVGLEGTNILFLKQEDAKIITDLMLGGDGTNLPDELNEMHLSCISEVMNQMMGAASTSLSKMLNKPIDISPPQAYQVNLADPISYPFSEMEDVIVRIGFDMVVEGLINSEIIQVTPLAFAKDMVLSLMAKNEPAPAPAAVSPPPPPAAAESAATPPISPPPRPAPAAPATAPQPPYPSWTNAPGSGTVVSSPESYAPAQTRHPPVDVRPMQYVSFDGSPMSESVGENMDLLLDVPLQVSVELGKSRKYIKEILDFNVGSIIVLDKMAGELVDVMVNGKLIARGEVVVIDESFGCRITDIISPSKRINLEK